MTHVLELQIASMTYHCNCLSIPWTRELFHSELPIKMSTRDTDSVHTHSDIYDGLIQQDSLPRLFPTQCQRSIPRKKDKRSSPAESIHGGEHVMMYDSNSLSSDGNLRICM